MREMTRLQSNFVLEVRISYLGQTSGKNSPFLLIATRQPLEFNIEMLSYFMDMELLFFLRLADLMIDHTGDDEGKKLSEKRKRKRK